MPTFTKRRVDVKRSLETSRSRGAISLDGWFSSSDPHLLGIVEYWIDKGGKLQKTVLAMSQLLGGTGDKDYAPAIVQMIEYYQIGSKLGGFQTDKADHNDICLLQLAALYRINVAEQRLHCFGHVVNLVVKGLLFGTGLSKAQMDIAGANDDSEFELWRARGAIGKLHNIVTYISRSGKRTLVFSAIKCELANDLMAFCLELKLDTGIRWNNVYPNIRRALKLDRPMSFFVARWQKGKVESHNLSKDELNQQDR